MVARCKSLFLGGIAALALLTAGASAQVEGPLDNDSYLPIDTAAEQELARGDQAFAAALKLPEGSDSRTIATAWTATCEAWRNALVHSEIGLSASPRPIVKPTDVSPWPTNESGVDRFNEGLEEAVFRRIASLPKLGQQIWRERFSALAQEQLQKAGADAASVARIERELPATPAAARAAILLSEIAFESGDTSAARRWLARARRQLATLALDEPTLEKGIALRERALPALPTPEAAIWQHATALEFSVGRALENPRNQTQRTRALGAGPQAGMAFLDGDRALLQTPSALWILSGSKAELSGPFDNNSWLGSITLEVEPTVAPGNAPGWRLDPAAQGSSAVVVLGRSLGGRPNVLACVDFTALDPQPHLRWAIAAASSSVAEASATNTDEYEFEPGPLWSNGLVIVLVRRANSTSGEHEMELRALDPSDGSLRWRTYIGKGGERVRDMGRFARRGVATMPAEPLVETEGGIFASAQLGFCAMVDPLDGRALFGVRNHRRPAEERGFTGWGASLADGGRTIAWAPADSDHVYLLDSNGPAQRGTPFIAPPQPLGEAEALVQGDGKQVLVLAKSGARGALSRWDLSSGARQDALHLGPEEIFTGRALASDQRVIAASDRALYVFDRSQELALLAAPTLSGPIPRGGNVWAKAARVYVLSNRFVEVFAAH